MIHPSPPIPGDTLSSYLRRLQNYAQEGEVGSSPDGLVRRGPGGTTIGQRDDFKHPPFHNRGVYDTGSAFYVNDIVRVQEAATYTVGSETFSSPLGTYICVRPVPPGAPSFDPEDVPSHLSYYAEALTRDSLLCYAPIIPEPEDLEERFWERLGGGGSDSYTTYTFNSVYGAGDWVRYTGSIRSFYYEGHLKFTYPGTWKCIKNVPPSGSSRTASFFMPVWAEPTGSTVSNPENVRYWELISTYPQVEGVCQDGQAKDFLTDTQEFMPLGLTSQSLNLPVY